MLNIQQEPVNLVTILVTLVQVEKLTNVLIVLLLLIYMKEDVEKYVQMDILEEIEKETENVIHVTLLV
jgi:hypothetical protein